MKLSFIFLFVFSLYILEGCNNKQCENCKKLVINKSADIYKQVCTNQDSSIVEYIYAEPQGTSYAYKINNKCFVEAYDLKTKPNRLFFGELYSFTYDLSKKDTFIHNGISIEYYSGDSIRYIRHYKKDILDGEEIHFREDGRIDYVMMYKNNKVVSKQVIIPPDSLP